MILIAFRLRSSSSLLADTMIVEDWVRRALIFFAIQRLSMTLGVSARQLSQPLRYPIQIHVLVGLSRTVSIVLGVIMPRPWHQFRMLIGEIFLSCLRFLQGPSSWLLIFIGALSSNSTTDVIRKQ